jgi:ATP-dependent RNA helicase HelY
MTEPSPSERYAAYRRDREARRGQRADEPDLAAFRALYDFEFDDFQVAACRALAERAAGRPDRVG